MGLFHPASCYLGEKTDFHTATSSFQVRSLGWVSQAEDYGRLNHGRISPGVRYVSLCNTSYSPVGFTFLLFVSS